jgi:hypothetical protein
MSETKPDNPQDKVPPADILKPIEAAAEIEAAVSEPQKDPRLPSETAELERARREQLKTEEVRTVLDRGKKVHDLRTYYTGRLFWLAVGWLLVVVIFVALSGFRFMGFYLSDTVLVAFITSTTLNVIGLFLVAARWLYPHSHTDDKEEASKK